jgi:hypothetical protein
LEGSAVASILVGYLAAGAFYVLREIRLPRGGATRLVTGRPPYISALVWTGWPVVSVMGIARSALAQGWRRATYFALLDSGPPTAILLTSVLITIPT